jgi:hypothetical protein
MKRCSRCNREKKITCKGMCANCYKTVWRQSNPHQQAKARVYTAKSNDAKGPEWRFNRSLIYKHGITIEDYYRILAKQKGKCAICRTEKPGHSRMLFFCVDHDHKTGKVRGLLCDDCNLGIGKLKDSRGNLLRAWRYLRHHES